MSEEEMARLVVTELQRQGFVTYEEVSLGYAGNRADIVATRGPVLAVVECKASLSLRLLDQLTEWAGQAHLIIGAIGKGRHGAATLAFCRSQGIGLWTVGASEVFEVVAPRLHRRAAVSRVRKVLRPEHQSGEFARAGSMSGAYYSPFRGTVKALQETVRQTPGIELRDALKAIGHHYASTRSAMSAIPALITKGVIVGVRVEGRPLRCYPVEAP